MHRTVDRPVTFFAVIATICALPFIAFGPYSFMPALDYADSHFTRYISMLNYGGQERISYWNPFAMGGVDFLANGQRPYDGFAFLFTFLPGWLVTGIMRFLQIFLAGYFMMRTLRDHLNIPAGIAIVGGIFILGANGVNGVLIEYYIGYGTVPLLMWLFPYLCRRDILTICLVSSMLGLVYGSFAFAHLTTYAIVPVVFLWALFVEWGRRWRVLIAIGVFAVCAFAIEGEMLAAMAANVALSHRVIRSSISGAPSALSIYNMLPVFTVILAFVLTKQFRNKTLLWVSGVSCGVVFIVEAHWGLKMVVANLPSMIRGFESGRMFQVLPFILTIGLAYGIMILRDKFKESTGLRRLEMPVLAIVLSVSVIPVSLSVYGPVRDWFLWGSFSANFNNEKLRQLGELSRASDAPFRVATVQENGLLSAYAPYYGLETADNYINVIPAAYYQYWGQVIKPALKKNAHWAEYYSNFGSRLSLFTDDGHPLPLLAQDYFNDQLLALANVHYIISNVPIDHPRLILDEETRPDVFWDQLSSLEKLKRRLKENFTTRPVLIYRVLDPLPRWFLTSEVRSFDSSTALFDALPAASRDDLRASVWLEAEAASGMGAVSGGALSGAAAEGTLKAEVYSPDLVSLKVTTPQRAALVVTNNWSPFWHAYIDGTEQRIFRAYGTFWAVSVSPGTHRIDFRYEPPYALFGHSSALE